MRVYGISDVLRMAVINVCRETGMSIAVIQDMMDELQKAETQESAEDIFHKALYARKRELTSEVSTLHRQMQLVTELLDYDSTAESDRLNDNRDQSSLTDQERRCLELMVDGQSTLKISREMEIRLEEAQALEAAVIQKFGTNNRFQAVAKAVLLGIVKT
jgi:DNA-binding CsgD family transcriptional regulator